MRGIRKDSQVAQGFEPRAESRRRAGVRAEEALCAVQRSIAGEERYLTAPTRSQEYNFITDRPKVGRIAVDGCRVRIIDEPRRGGQHLARFEALET